MTEPSPETTQPDPVDAVPSPESAPPAEEAPPADPVALLTQEVDRWKDLAYRSQAEEALSQRGGETVRTL